MKNKPLRHKESNTFRFQPFSERISNINVDVFHRVKHRYEEESEDETYLYQAIEKWSLLNCSDSFQELVSEITTHVRILPQVLALKDRIVEVLLKHLAAKNPLNLQAVLELTVALVKDLRHEFYPHYEAFLSQLISLLDTKDSDQLEWTFECLAYIFKFLWRLLVKNLPTVFEKLLPLFSSSRPNYINNFAAESFAFVARKVKDHNKFIRLILRSLKKFPRGINGCGRLLFEVVQGVPGQFHSCAEGTLASLLECLADDTIDCSLLFEVLTNTVSHLVKAIQPKHSSLLWKTFQTYLDKYHAVWKSEQNEFNASKVLEVLTLIHQVVEHKSCTLVIDPASLVDQLLRVIEPDNQINTEVVTSTVNILSLLLLSPSIQLTQELASKIINCALLNLKEGILITFISGIFNFVGFEGLVLPRLLDFSMTQNPMTMLPLLSELITCKTPPAGTVEQLLEWTPYSLDFRNCKKGDQAKYSHAVLDVLSVKSGDDCINDVDNITCSLVVLPHLLPVCKESAYTKLEKLIHLLSKQIDDENAENKANSGESVTLSSRISVFIHLLSVALETLIYLKPDSLTKIIKPELLVNTLLPYSNLPNYLSALRALSFYISSDEFNSTAVFADKIKEKILDNLLSPYQKVRLLTTHIFYELEKANVNSNEKMLHLLENSWRAESVPIVFERYREKLRYLQELECNEGLALSVSNSEVNPHIPLKHLLGILYVNFKLFWEPVMHLIASYAQFINHTQFWGTFGPQLKSVARHIKGLDIDVTPECAYKYEFLSTAFKNLNTLDDRPDHINYRILLWTCMAEFPEVCELKNRDISDEFFKFMEEEYFRRNADQARTWNIKKREEDISNENAEGEEMDVDEELSEDDDIKKTLTQPVPELNNKFRLANKTLLTKLKVFSKLRNPRTIYREPELNSLYHEFLSHKLPDVQKAALDCIMTYKHKYMLPYKENLYRLIDEKHFKNEITIFRVDTQSDVVKTEHRANIIPLVLRIAYSKMKSSVGMKSVGGNAKTNWQARRAIVIRFLAGCSPEELSSFFQMSFHFLTNLVKDDAVEMVEDIFRNLDLESVIPPKRLYSSANLLNVFVIHCGGLLNSKLLAFLLRILLSQTSIMSAILSKRNDVHPGYIRTLRNVRTACFEAVMKFFERFTSYNWKANEIDAVFKVFVWPWLEKLTLEGVHSPTPLLKLITVWSHNPIYFPLLGKRIDDGDLSPLPVIMELWLSPKTHASVCNMIMDIVERLLTLKYTSDEMEPSIELPVNNKAIIDEEKVNLIKVSEELNYGSKLLIPHIPKVLERLRQKLLRGPKQGLIKRDLEVMSRVTELVCDAESSETILNLLLPVLMKKARASEHILTPLLMTTFNLMKNIVAPERYIRNLAPLFGKVNGTENRKILLEIVTELGHLAKDESGLDIGLLEDLNAWDSKWIDQPDFNRRLDAFKRLEVLSDENKISINMGVIVIYTCSYFLSAEKDLSLKDNASYCLKKLCPALCLYYKKNFQDRKYLVDDVILSFLREGIKDKQNEFIRNESIALLGCMARQCEELHPVLRDLSLLGNKDDLEVDFFENLQHLQLHRKVRAMLKFCEVAKGLDKAPNSRTLTQFILPLVSYFLCWDKYSGKNTIIDSAIQALGTVCRLLPWHQYSTILSYYLGKLRFNIEYQKQLVRINVEILNSFHFDLSRANLSKEDLLPVLPKDKETTVIEKEIKEETEEKKDEESETKDSSEVADEETKEKEDIEQELEEKLNVDDNTAVIEETNSIPVKAVDQQIVLAKSGALRVIDVIRNNFLPLLNRSMAHRTQVETTHRLNRKLIGPDKDEEDILKVPLAIAVVKLLQKLPQGVLDIHLPGVLMKLCTFLKSRLDSVRRVTRETLQTIMVSVGPQYLNVLLNEMKAILTRGFHIHVLVYSIHSVLVALKPLFKENEIVGCMNTLLNLCMIDLFGDPSEEKEVVQITGKVMEARANRSYDIFNIMATYVSEGVLLDLILPLKEQLSKTLSHKNTSKASECFQQVVLGLMENKFIPVESLLQFSYGVATESIPSLVPITEEKKIDPKMFELENRKPKDSFIIPEEPKRQKAVESKTCSHTNAHILVEFGLRLIYFVLKREKLKGIDARPYLDPLVKLFADCLQSQHVRVSTLAIQSLCWLLHMDLPSLRTNIKQITSALFAILHKYAAAGLSKGDNFDLVMITFKAVAVLVRDVKYYYLEAKHLRALLLYCEQDLDDHSRRATAFSLVKAIVARKIQTPELHEIILKVANLSISSNVESVRLQARQVVHSYLMDYPLGKKLDGYLAFYFSQLNYEYQPGRESAYEMMNTVVNTFPIELLQEQSGVIFVNIAACLINDSVPECRKKVADIITALLTRVDNNTANKLFSITELWMKDNNISHRQLAAQLIGIFVSCEKDKFERRLDTVLPLVITEIINGFRENKPGKFVRINSELEENDSCDDKEKAYDHHLYQVLQMLIKMCSLCPKMFCDNKYTDNLEIIADNAHSLLAHPHEWVRFSSVQLLGLIISKIPADDIASVANKERGETSGYLMNNTRFRLKSLALDLSSQLFPGELVNEKFMMQCMKLLVCIADILKGFKENNEFNDGLSLLWLVRRIRKLINNEIAQAPTSTVVRSMCFNWIAAVSLKFDKEILNMISYHLLAPLAREMNSLEESNSTLKQVATEAAGYIKKKIGTDEYNNLMLKLSTKMDIKRSQRKKERAQLVVTNPEKAAKRKLARQQKKKALKKRKVELFKTKKFKRKQKKEIDLDI